MTVRTPSMVPTLYFKIAAAGCFGLLSLASLVEGYIPIFSPVVSVIRMISFIVHEAGHPFFGVFGTFLGWLGGTIAQLVPGVWICLSSFFRGRTYALSFGLFWLGLNLFDISAYMADANDRKLELFHPGMIFGESIGDAHDWGNIFGALGLLGFAKGFAFVTASVGVSCFVSSVVNVLLPLPVLVTILLAELGVSGTGGGEPAGERQSRRGEAE